MSITHLNSVAQLNELLSKSKDKLSVIDFHATWSGLLGLGPRLVCHSLLTRCGPCHAIAPTFESLSKQYPNVNFFKCDVDAAKDVAALYRVTSMPTFIFLRSSTKIDQIRGADRAGLQSAVKRHSSASASSSSFSGHGRTLGSAAPAPSDIPMEARAKLNKVASGFADLDSQFQVLLALVGAYIMFLYFSGNI